MPAKRKSKASDAGDSKSANDADSAAAAANKKQHTASAAPATADVKDVKSDAASSGSSSSATSKAAAPKPVFAVPPSPTLQPKRKPIRVWIDGCFDLMHWGHANAIRQAKELCDVLVVGVHSDADILRHKGPPVMKEAERYRAVAACKWVDQVVEGAPYVTQLATLDEHNIDFCVHGEDVTTDENGRDCYYEVKQAGRYKTIKRSESVSTTDIVGRMILMTKDHLASVPSTPAAAQSAQIEASKGAVPVSHVLSNVLSTTNRIVQFGSTAGSADHAARRAAARARMLNSSSLDDAGVNASAVAAGHRPERIVYIDGAFDLFHVGHIDALAEARKFGTYLIVGVHDDTVVNRIKGANLPIMNLHERVLSVLACRYTDEVVIGAPWAVTKQLIEAMKIDVVAHGTTSDYQAPAGTPNSFEVAKQLGIYKEFQSTSPSLTTTSLLERILANRLLYIERNRKKEAKETAAGNSGATVAATASAHAK